MVTIQCTCLVGLYDGSNEKQKDVLLKGGQVARVDHSLKTWHPAASLPGNLFKNNSDSCTMLY